MRAKLSIILLACITLIPPSQCMEGQSPKISSTTKQATKHVEQGDIYLDEGAYDEAIDEYTAAIELVPKMALAYWGRGRAYHFGKGIYWKAVDDYSESIELDPKYTKAYFYRGLANVATQEYDRAISDFTRSIELEPNLSMAYNLRAWCYFHKALWEQSSQLLLSQLLEKDPSLAEAYKGQVWTYVRQAQWEFFTMPDSVKSKEPRLTQDESEGSSPTSPAGSAEKYIKKSTGKPYVNVTPVSGPVGTKLFIYGWGFRGNEDGITITWDGEIIKYNIRAEIDGSLIIDGSKVPHNSRAYTGDTRETVYIPPTAQGCHILGVYGSSFTPIGIVNDTIIEVIPAIKVFSEPSIKGTQAIITGTGFASNEAIAVSINKAATGNTATADSNGSFSVTLLIPASKVKEYHITVSGNRGNSAQSSLTIASERTIPPEQVSNLAEVYCNKGYAHFRKAQWALVIADLDKKYMREPALNRSSWNRDWARSKQKQWDAVIADYEKVITLLGGVAIPQDKPVTGLYTEELTLALADYSKAAEVSRDPAFAQKMKGIIKSIEEWSKGLDK